MAEHTSLHGLFTAIANSIRGKTGTTESICADNFPSAIDDINISGSSFPNGTIWKKSNLTNYLWCKPTYANGIWVISSINNVDGLYYSADGKTWTQSNITSGRFDSIVYADGLWIAHGAVRASVSTYASNGLYYSTDGKIWTQSNVTTGAFVKVTKANGLWIAAGIEDNGLYYSTDGMNWNQSDQTDLTFIGVINGNGLWVAWTATKILYSIDGKVWTIGTSTGLGMSEVAYGNGVWVACGVNNDGRLRFSKDGMNWTVISADAGASGSNGNALGASKVGYFNDRFILYDNNGGLRYSTNGETWAKPTTIDGKTLNGNYTYLAYANGVWITCDNYYTQTGLHYSTDGKTWVQSNMTSGWFRNPTNTNGIWIINSVDTGLYYSADGKTWTQSNITSGRFNLVQGNGVWIASADEVSEGVYYSVGWEA